MLEEESVHARDVSDGSDRGTNGKMAREKLSIGIWGDLTRDEYLRGGDILQP